MLNRSIIGATLAMACVASASAFAAPESAWYAGAGVGSARVSFDNSDFSVASFPAFATVSESHDRSQAAYKVFLGYSLNRYLSLEAAYLDLGTYRYSYTDTPSGFASDDLKVNGFNFSLVGAYPITERFSVFGKVGAFRAKVKSNSMADPVYAANYAPYPVGSSSSTKTTLSSGLGLDYALNANFSVRGEYEFFQKVGSSVDANNAGTGRVTPSMISLSLVYKY
ncbi:MAG: hypothetical protein NVSMB6_24910 [Burkholderiaceae bacterium]